MLICSCPLTLATPRIGAGMPLTLRLTPSRSVGNGAGPATTAPFKPSVRLTPKTVPVLPGTQPGWKLAPFTKFALEPTGARPVTRRLNSARIVGTWLTLEDFCGSVCELATMARTRTGPAVVPARNRVEALPWALVRLKGIVTLPSP